MILTTERLVLREMEESDYDALYRVLADPENMRYYPYPFGEERILISLAGYSLSMYMVNKALATLLVMIWNYFTKKAILESAFLTRRTGN